jgi:hypothetical protein
LIRGTTNVSCQSFGKPEMIRVVVNNFFSLTSQLTGLQHHFYGPIGDTQRILRHTLKRRVVCDIQHL